MNNVDLYHKNNDLQRTGAVQHLENYKNIIEWRKDASILDIGCGDGSLTVDLIKKTVPHYGKLIGCDINKDMVQFANKHYSSENVSFVEYDISDDLPDHFRSQFQHVFSFYALHWVQNQEKAFQNIYDLMNKTGDCLMLFVGQGALYDAYKKLAQNIRWSQWLKDWKKFQSPYHDVQDPEKQIRQMLSKIGFTKVEIQHKQISFQYESMEAIRGGIKAITAFKIPEDLFDEFLDDMFHEMQLADTEKYNLEKSVYEFIHNFCVFFIYVKK